MKNFARVCCGYKTLGHPPDGTYEICGVCFWEDDPIQLKDPNYERGANTTSLRQAQANFINYGASEKKFLINVRPPAKDEARDENWKPFD